MHGSDARPHGGFLRKFRSHKNLRQEQVPEKPTITITTTITSQPRPRRPSSPTPAPQSAPCTRPAMSVLPPPPPPVPSVKFDGLRMHPPLAVDRPPRTAQRTATRSCDYHARRAPPPLAQRTLRVTRSMHNMTYHHPQQAPLSATTTSPATLAPAVEIHEGFDFGFPNSPYNRPSRPRPIVRNIDTAAAAAPRSFFDVDDSDEDDDDDDEEDDTEDTDDDMDRVPSLTNSCSSSTFSNDSSECGSPATPRSAKPRAVALGLGKEAEYFSRGDWKRRGIVFGVPAEQAEPEGDEVFDLYY